MLLQIYYNFDIFFKKTSGKSVYKGIHFAKYSAKRTDFSGNSSNPGPGDYDTSEAVKIDVQHYNIKNESKTELLIPRYPEAHILNVEKEVCYLIKMIQN
jgi:hypothetical protein